MIRKEQNFNKLGNISASDFSIFAKGRMFGDWIDQAGRTNSFNVGDLIESPVYIAESLLRDEALTETDLKITSVDATNVSLGYVDIVISEGLRHWRDNFYVGATLINNLVSTQHNIIASVFATNTLTITVATDGSTTPIVNDIVAISNVTSFLSINVNKFDAIHAAHYSNWKMRRSIIEGFYATDLLSSLMYESAMILTENSYEGVDIYSLLKKTTADGVLTTPLHNKNSLVKARLTPLENIYTSFVLKYNRNVSTDSFLNTIEINKNSSWNLSSTYSDYCNSAIVNYRLNRVYDQELLWHYDDATVQLFAEWLVKWFTWQKLQITWVGDIKNHIHYEIGDQVMIDHDMIPTSKRNSAFFIIIGKTVNITKMAVTLSLLEVR